MTKILVIGETCIDEYVYGTCKKVCPEAAALCFSRSSQETKTNLGMAANVLSNLRSIDPTLFCDIITNNNHHNNPIIKRRFIDIKYNTIIFREDINDSCSSMSDNIINTNDYDIVVVSDYDKGFLSYENYAQIRHAHPNAIIFADTKKIIDGRILSNVNILKINSTEYRLSQANLANLPYTCILVITTGSEGCFMIKDNTTKYFQSKPIEVRDVCGAGDTFLAALVARYSHNKNIEESIHFANIMAGKVVQKLGIAVP